MLVCQNGHLDVLNRLTELGAEGAHAVGHGLTGRVLACCQGPFDVLNQLVELGAESIGCLGMG